MAAKKGTTTIYVENPAPRGAKSMGKSKKRKSGKKTHHRKTNPANPAKRKRTHHRKHRKTNPANPHRGRRRHARRRKNPGGDMLVAVAKAVGGGLLAGGAVVGGTMLAQKLPASKPVAVAGMLAMGAVAGGALAAFGLPAAGATAATLFGAGAVQTAMSPTMATSSKLLPSATKTANALVDVNRVNAVVDVASRIRR